MLKNHVFKPDDHMMQIKDKFRTSKKNLMRIVGEYY